MKTKERRDVCAACGASDTDVREVVTTQLFRGEDLAVSTPATVCRKCRFQFLAKGQLDELRKRTADAYRRKHRLLTSEEIVLRRKALGLTQEQFAEQLRVGVASIKRWETWLVQEKSSDELIRSKTDEDMLISLVAKAIRNAQATPITASAYSQIVEGERNHSN